MADIENPAPATATATPPDRSRHGFWAWKERFAISLYAPEDPNDEPAEGVKTADAEQCSRHVFVWTCALFLTGLLVGSMYLTVYVEPSTAGHAAFVASHVVGYVGLAAVVCLGSFVLGLCSSIAAGDRDEQRTIDALM